MLIGVVADTHDNLPKLEQALARFKAAGVELVLHAGDFVSPFVAVPFKEAGLPVIGVFGNNDGDKLFLRERFSGLGELHHGPHELELAGRKIVLMHEPRALPALAASGKYDLLIYGHTHKQDLRPGPPLILNPGECGGWLSGQASCAIVDLTTLKTELVPI
ncbi:metallophosphoesterase [Candidatus Bipolaricaulota bacterium]|nr:metallophosphoesterase [Candidatus Bipolaricaulota bacterium]